MKHKNDRHLFPTERSFLMLFFFFCAFADDVWRAAFAFVIDAADVFAEDAHEGELDAADKEDEGDDEGRVARDVFAVEQGAQDNEDEVDGGDEGEEAAGEGCDAQGRRREAGNAVDGQVEEFPVVPLGLARGPGRPVEEDFFLLKANPAEEAFRVALTFAQAAQGFDAAFVQEAEVADIFLDRDRG